MAMSSEYSLADISAATGGNRNNGGLFGGDGAWWIVILFLFGMFGGWGGGFGGGWGGGGQQGYDTRADVQRGFDNQAIVTKLDGITQGICDATYALNNTMTNGFHGVDNAVSTLGYQVMQGQSNLAAQLATCCCETREAIQGVNYNMATQACETRNVIQNTTRDIIDNQNANSRAILDALNQNYIRSLESENQGLKLAASQANQNAVLQAAMDANTAEILRRTAPVPVPAYQVPNPYAHYGYNYGCSPCGAAC